MKKITTGNIKEVWLLGTYYSSSFEVEFYTSSCKTARSYEGDSYNKTARKGRVVKIGKDYFVVGVNRVRPIRSYETHKKIKSRALKKLTPKEKQVLGLMN